MAAREMGLEELDEGAAMDGALWCSPAVVGEGVVEVADNCANGDREGDATEVLEAAALLLLGSKKRCVSRLRER